MTLDCRNGINDKHIATAVNVLRSGGVMIYPTDTIYAFGCDALQNNAIEKICTIKGMRSDKSLLSIICNDLAQVSEYARMNNDTFKLMRANLPGPFTFVLPALSKLPKAFKGRKTVGIRIPDNETARHLVAELGHPIMTSSVPVEDEDYGTEPELMAEFYGNRIDAVIDAGRGDTSPSTIVDCTGDTPEIVREGKGILRY